jgi:nucleoid DNA-binding protein
MNNIKISATEIIDTLSERLSVSKRTAEDFLKAMFVVIEEQLLTGEAVKISHFGSFKLQWNEARKSVNVNTGEEILIEGFYKTVFTPEPSLKDIVNEPFAHLEPVSLTDDVTSLPKAENDAPLRTLGKQASEILGILSEINQLNNNERLKKEQIVEQIVEEKKEEAEEKEELTEEKATETENITEETKDESKPEIEAEEKEELTEEKAIETEDVTEETEDESKAEIEAEEIEESAEEKAIETEDVTEETEDENKAEIEAGEIEEPVEENAIETKDVTEETEDESKAEIEAGEIEES